MPEQFQHEDVAAVPRGYRVRTVHSGKHEIRVAYPPGPRRKGTAVLVSILHPRGENPHCHVKNIFLNPTALEKKRATRERAKKIREARLGNPYKESNVQRLIEIFHGFRDSGLPMREAVAETLTQYHASDDDRLEFKRRVSRRGFGLTSLENPSSVYSKAVSLGYPYLRGEGRTARNDRTWLSRVTRASDGSGPALYVGWDSINRKWIIETEGGGEYEPGPRIGRGGNPFDWREQREHGGTGSLFDAIRHGDKVTFVDRFGQQRTGRAVMRGPGGWVLNMGGAHGTPQVVHEDMVVRVRKSNPSSKPRKGESPEKYHERRVREMLAKMPKPIRDVFDRNPAAYKFVFRNPDDDELGGAERLYEEFHGRAPREILEMQESDEARGDFTALGDLVELTIVSPNGDHVQIKFKGDGVRVASSPDGNQLYFIGGNQDVSGELRKFGADESKDLVDLGETKQIVYDAAKWQTDFTGQEWKHDFGEKSGVRPRAFYDQLKKRILFAGGTYKVERPGIID
jgi:hypothetical protein